ncbi:MAG: VCBS repeat-containing protein, partial [Acidobacteria bacterium]|nr:VCBS repeat-containing protein [Acidobacteriota bacterium]
MTKWLAPWGVVGLLVLGCGGEGKIPPAAPGEVFTDVSQVVGLDFRHVNGRVGSLHFAEMMGSGAAMADFDGDGDLDLYLVQGGRLPGVTRPLLDPVTYPEPFTDRLYRNRLEEGHGLRFDDATTATGLTASGYGMGVAAADYDNDGDVDLYLTNYGANQLLRNRGDGSFEDVTVVSGTGDLRWSVPAVFFDFDRDGWLDLYVGNYVELSPGNEKECFSDTGARDYCGPASYPPETDRLFHNRGDGSFEDVTGAAGLLTAYGPALGAVAADFNGDGWLDLYVANDGVPNQLWINQHDGTFRDEALLGGAGVNASGLAEASMGATAADFDGDGDEDLFLTHLTRETNTLYTNDGSGTFEDASLRSGLGAPSIEATGFGTGFLDYDNDGRLDLLVVNGAVKILDSLAGRGDPYPLHQRNQLFHNLGGGRFEDVSGQAG